MINASPKSVEGQIVQKMQEGVGEGVFPGGVLLIHYQGQVIFHEAFGSAWLVPYKIPMRCDILFDLASLTKPLATAAATLMLIQEGVLALKDPASKFFPEFGHGPKRKITLRHLLNHSSGLPDWKPYYQEMIKEGEEGKDALGSSASKQKICQMVHEESLIAPPGKKSLYSDIGFILLGEIVEKVAGEPLHRFCFRKIFSKAGCKETTFIRTRQRPQRFRGRRFAATEDAPWYGIVCGRVHDENAYAMGGVAGHAGLFSTARETYLLVRLWMNSLRGEGEFDQKLATRFVTRQRQRGVPPDSTFGLGWDTPSSENSSSGKFFSPSSFGHLGFTGTSIWVDWEKDLVVVLLTNRIHPDRENKKIVAFRPELHDLIYQGVVGGP